MNPEDFQKIICQLTASLDQEWASYLDFCSQSPSHLEKLFECLVIVSLNRDPGELDALSIAIMRQAMKLGLLEAFQKLGEKKLFEGEN